jgi:hypothetical protein
MLLLTQHLHIQDQQALLYHHLEGLFHHQLPQFVLLDNHKEQDVTHLEAQIQTLVLELLLVIQCHQELIVLHQPQVLHYQHHVVLELVVVVECLVHQTQDLEINK